MKIRRVLPVICLLLICPGIGVAGNTLSAEDGGSGLGPSRTALDRWSLGKMAAKFPIGVSDFLEFVDPVLYFSTSAEAAFAINALRSKSSQDSERFEALDRSRTQKPKHPSNARRVDTELLRPSRTLFERNNPASAEGQFGLRDHSVPRTRRALGPRTGARGCRQFVQACHHSVAASRLRGSAPIRQARAPSGRSAAPTVAELRRPPADKSVKSETAGTLTAERRSRRRTPFRTRQDFLLKV